MEALPSPYGRAVVLGFVRVMNSYLQPKTGVADGHRHSRPDTDRRRLVMTVIARKTAFGRHVFAMGGNPESAELAGISVKKTIVKSSL